MTIADVLQALVFSLLAAGGGFLLTRLADNRPMGNVSCVTSPVTRPCWYRFAKSRTCVTAWRRKGARNR